MFWTPAILATVELAGAVFLWLAYGDPIPESHSAWLALLFVALALETIRVFLVRLATEIEALRSEREQR